MADRLDDVSFRRDTGEPDPDVEDSSGQSTVQIQQDTEACIDPHNLPGPTVTSAKAEDGLKTEENLTAMLMYLMDEVSKLRVELKGHKVENGADAASSQLAVDEDLESISTTNSGSPQKKLHPVDHGRWKASKAAE